jgi:hypothetical protein
MRAMGELDAQDQEEVVRYTAKLRSERGPWLTSSFSSFTRRRGRALPSPGGGLDVIRVAGTFAAGHISRAAVAAARPPGHAFAL